MKHAKPEIKMLERERCLALIRRAVEAHQRSGERWESLALQAVAREIEDGAQP